MALGPAVRLGARNGGVSGEVIERARSGPKTIAPSSSAKACLATEPVVLSRGDLDGHLALWAPTLVESAQLVASVTVVRP